MTTLLFQIETSNSYNLTLLGAVYIENVHNIASHSEVRLLF